MWKNAAFQLVLCVGASALHLQEGSSEQASYGHPSPQRHLQYTVKSSAGLSDREWIFGHLRKLGLYHKATVHIVGGRDASGWLGKHSNTKAANWSQYFDVDCKASPFNEIIDTPCEVWKGGDWKTMFDGGVTCRRLDHWYNYKGQLTCLDDFNVSWHLPPSRAVVEKARQFTGSGKNGFLHIRRCDRMSTNKVCTAPEQIRQVVTKFPDIKRWIIFHYAEPEYLSGLLDTLRNLTGRKFVTEDDIEWGSDDNFFKFAVSQEVLMSSSVSYDTHVCQGGEGLLNIGGVHPDRHRCFEASCKQEVETAAPIGIDRNQSTLARHVEESIFDKYSDKHLKSLGVCGR